MSSANCFTALVLGHQALRGLQNGAILPAGALQRALWEVMSLPDPGLPRSHGAEPQSRRATVWLSSVRGGPPALLSRRACGFVPRVVFCAAPFWIRAGKPPGSP